MSTLPNGWVEATLHEVADWGSGGTPKAGTAAYYGGSIPWAVIGDLTDGIVSETASTITGLGLANSSSKIVGTDVVLIAMYGSIGKLGKPAIPMATNQAIAFARPRQDVLMREYLFYYLMHARKRLAAAGKGATQQNISQTILKAWPIPIAPLPEQGRIAAVIEEQFSRLDAGVAALESAKKNLKRMRAAALSGLLHAEDGTPYPEVLLGDVLTSGRYGTSTKCSTVGQGMPVLRIPNVQLGKIDLSDLKYAIDVSVDLERTRVAENDILIIRTNGSRSLIGRAAVVSNVPHPIAFASYLIQLRVNPTSVISQYLVTALTAPRMRVRLEELAATTAGQYNISLDKLRSLRIPLPSLSQQRQALSMVEGLLSIVDRIDSDVENALIRADQLRSAVLARAFMGTLTPQDPTDEPASVLLKRIAAASASPNGRKPRRSSKPRVEREEVSA